MTYNYKSSFLQKLSTRGFLYQCTHDQEMDNLFAEGPQKLYIGFDATADSLHVGSLLPLMVLRWAHLCGHEVILLLGGGTTLVGDPSGKEETRTILTKEIICTYTKGIKESVGKLLPMQDDRVRVLNNADWLASLNYLDFLRDIGSLFSVNKMLALESVKTRLDRAQNLSFLEFNYMLCQAYDFFVLSDQQGCMIQGGGSDQWGNIVSGVDLIRRKSGKQAYGLTFPLIETRDGVKMGKTAGGAVWLHPEKKSAYDYWQYWRNVDDREIERFLLLFTCLDEETISDIVKGDPNKAKIRLADEATRLLRGEEVLGAIHETVAALSQEKAPYTVTTTPEGFPVVNTDLPLYKVNRSFLEQDSLLMNLLIEAGAIESKSAVRRLIRDGALSLDGEKIQDELYQISLKDLIDPFVIHIKIGKKKNLLLQVLP